MRYTIYKITNLLNGKFYIGKHQTINPNDRYFGSGKAILNAIKLHGKANFIKEILFDFDSEEAMNAKERELVTEELVADSMSYNMAVGGEGGPHFRNRTHSLEAKEKISLKRKTVKISDDGRRKLSERRLAEATKQKISEYAKKRVWSEETKRKISETMRNRNKN